jgi:hypothetical protein
MADATAAAHAGRFEVRVTADSHFAWLPTRLALERTMMAWLRTAVSLMRSSCRCTGLCETDAWISQEITVRQPSYKFVVADGEAGGMPSSAVCTFADPGDCSVSPHPPPSPATG